MIRPAEMAAGIYGAWKLLRRDPAGLAFFRDDLDGCLKSFWAAALVAPGEMALHILGNGAELTAHAAAVHTIATVIGWVLFPLVMSNIADGLGRGQHYFRFVSAYNWSAVIQMAAFLPVAILGKAFPGPATALLAVSVWVILLVYQAYVAHTALAVKPGIAGAIVFLDFLLGQIIQMGADHLA
jgi:hypothetical protein